MSKAMSFAVAASYGSLVGAVLALGTAWLGATMLAAAVMFVAVTTGWVVGSWLDTRK